jgi:hypothetical protein
MGSQLEAKALRSRQVLHIIWLDVGPCIIVLVLYRFRCVSKTRTLHYVELCCNLRTYYNNSLLFRLCVCDVLLCNYYFYNDAP